jgi:hypothetical protein
MTNRIGSRRGLRSVGMTGFVVAAFAALMTIAPVASADQVIASSGPLTQIFLNSDLSCQAAYSGDTDGEFYSSDSGITPNGACGTFVEWNESVFGPNVPAGNSRTEFHQVDQTGVTGTGTAADPFKVVTTVDVEQVSQTASAQPAAVEGPVLFTVVQTDTYVIGDELYRSDIEVLNNGIIDGTFEGTLYHAGDCFLQNSDDGFGWFNPADNGPYCTENPGNSPFGRIEGFVPLTGGSHFYEANYNDVWDAINGSGGQFPDTVNTNGNGGSAEDNGAGLSWPLSIPVGESSTFSLLTRFSPTGGAPPATLAQQPPAACKLRISRARIFLFSRHPRMRLVARYRSSEPADVNIDYVAVGNGHKVPLGEVVKHFSKHGLFRLRKELTEADAENLRSTDRFIVHFKIPGEPGFCARQYTKNLTVPRIVEGQRVVFQEDSKFPQPGAGHPES